MRIVYSGELLDVELLALMFKEAGKSPKCKKEPNATSKKLKVNRKDLLYFNVQLNQSGCIYAAVWKKIVGPLSKLSEKQAND